MRLNAQRLRAQPLLNTCTVQHPQAKARLLQQRTAKPILLPYSYPELMDACIVLTSLKAKHEDLQPLLSEATVRSYSRVYATTPDSAGLVITQQVIVWLTELYKVTGAVNPRLDVVPCLACAGWTVDKLAGLQDVQLLVASSDLQQQAVQLQHQLNSNTAAQHRIQLHTLDKRSEDDLTQQPAGEPQAAAAAAAAATAAAGGDAATAAAGGDAAPTGQQQQSQEQQQQPELLYDHVAVGGTFDRLHAGHRLLLAATALVSRSSIYVGITSDALLAKKSNRQLLQDYNTRQNAAVDFMVLVRPSVTVTAGALTDPAEPTQAELDPKMQALVVSQETVPGGEAINQGRIRRGFEPLHLVVVGLIGGNDAKNKLSSTALREADAASVDTSANR